MIRKLGEAKMASRGLLYVRSQYAGALKAKQAADSLVAEWEARLARAARQREERIAALGPRDTKAYARWWKRYDEVYQ